MLTNTQKTDILPVFYHLSSDAIGKVCSEGPILSIIGHEKIRLRLIMRDNEWSILGSLWTFSAINQVHINNMVRFLLTDRVQCFNPWMKKCICRKNNIIDAIDDHLPFSMLNRSGQCGMILLQKLLSKYKRKLNSFCNKECIDMPIYLWVVLLILIVLLILLAS